MIVLLEHLILIIVKLFKKFFLNFLMINLFTLIHEKDYIVFNVKKITHWVMQLKRMVNYIAKLDIN